MFIHLGDVPSWIAAFGTLFAFIVAFKQINTERDIRKRNEIRDELANRSRQASKIAPWITSEINNKTTVAIRNGSDEPVYKAIVSVGTFQGAGPNPQLLNRDLNYRRFIPIVPPGTWYVDLGFIDRGMFFHPGLEIAFSDTLGFAWVRDIFGNLSELQSNQFEYYDVHPPYGWTTVRSEP